MLHEMLKNMYWKMLCWQDHLLCCIVYLIVWCLCGKMLHTVVGNEKYCLARGAADQTIYYKPCEGISPAVQAFTFLLKSQQFFIKNCLLLVKLLVFPGITMRKFFRMQIVRISLAWNISRTLVCRFLDYLIWLELPCKRSHHAILHLTSFFSFVKERQSLLLHCLFAWSNISVVLNVGFLLLHNR